MAGYLDMNLTKEEFQEFLEDVLTVMDKTGEDEPCEREAVKKLKSEWLLTDKAAKELESKAFFKWPDYVSVNGRCDDVA